MKDKSIPVSSCDTKIQVLCLFLLLYNIMNSVLPIPIPSPSCSMNTEHFCLESVSPTTLMNAYFSLPAFTKTTELSSANYLRNLLSHHPLVTELLSSLNSFEQLFQTIRPTLFFIYACCAQIVTIHPAVPPMKVSPL